MQSQVVGGNSSAVISRGLAIVRSRAPTDPAASIALLGHIGRFSCAEACKTFSDLLRGPLAALPPAETIAVFRQAVTMPQSDDQKIGIVDVGIKQCQRLAATDLPATVDLLAMLAPLGDRPTVDDCLAGLLGKPLDKASCADVAKVVRGAKAFAGATGEKQLFQAGIDWVNRHPQAPRPDVLSLLDQLDELHEADRARVAAIRRPLLEKLVAENPGDVDLAVRLAVTLEAEGRQGTAGGKENPAERIVKLLLPQREKLGAGEGARVLGQALAAQGKFDESYALLGPYLDQRLTAFHEAERAFEDAIEQARGRIIAQFQNGTAPGFDFARAHAASAEQRQSMAMEYINRQIKDDPAVDAAREKLASQGMVVPAALDLGMVTLQRAQSMKDAAARRTELERAEKTFLAIRGTAGESDQYMLRLGQVYYWLGKQDEGRQEFDKLLAKHQRKAEILFSLANVLRDLGALAEARKLMEEAYAKTADEKERQGIAELRAITSTGLEDEIHWLERSNAGQDSVKALLAETRGTQAENLGKDDEAAARYREAVAIYERQPPDASVLNNGALACLRVFAITGDRQALDRGTQWLEKAVSLSPMDSVVLANAANQISQAAIQDLAGDQFNLRELQMTHDINALYYLAGDQRGLDELRRRAREHAGLRKCLDYFNRVSVLASKNVANNLSALAIYSFLRDREALQRIARQVAAARPDTDEIDAHTIKYYQYKDEESTEERSRTRIARAEALVARLGGRDKGPAFAAAVDGLIDRKLSGKDNASVDAGELVRLADDAHRAAPSMATYATLAKALMFRANKKLAADHPTYATAIRGTARALSASCVVALTLARSDDLGKAAREDPDVQRAIALMAAEMEVFPESRSWLIWAVLGAAKPPRDDLRTKCLTPDELDEIQRDVGQSLAPINAHAAVETYWRRQATGAANAREPLDRLAKLGVPLPLGLIPAAGEKK
jgi:tetratricopeptide (TPR) repeat protein